MLGWSKSVHKVSPLILVPGKLKGKRTKKEKRPGEGILCFYSPLCYGVCLRGQQANFPACYNEKKTWQHNQYCQTSR